MGRFINADAYVSTGQGFTGNNMFAYCGNNPVNCCDPSGEFASAIILSALLSGLTAGVASAILAWAYGSSEEEIREEFWWGFGLGTIGSTGWVGTLISIGVGALKCYCDNREDGMSIRTSTYATGVSTIGSLPLPSMGSFDTDLLYATALGSYFSIVSGLVTHFAQENPANGPPETSANKTTFYHNARAVASIGGSFRITCTTYMPGGADQYVRI